MTDFRATVALSPWVAEVPWLREEAAIWQRELVPVRQRLEREAALLARPRVWVDTVANLLGTGRRMAGAADPLDVLAAAAGAFGLPVGPARAAGLREAEQIVRAGGPAYVKLGQFIASADGLLPPEWVQAFAWCRDRVPPSADGLAVMRSELGERFSELHDLEPDSFAAASIGQVHRARLADGTEVVVKVQRPDLRARFAADVESLALVAAAAHRARPALRAANLPGFVELFAQLALAELDFRLEALNMVELGAAAGDSGLDYVTFPRPIPGMVTQRVLVMEAVPGLPYTEAAVTDGSRLLALAIRGVLEGTLTHGLFHGDMHAGNVLVHGGDRFSLVDFGICGRLTEQERTGLVDYLVAFATRDARAQVDALARFGALPADADRPALSERLQAVLPESLTVATLGENLGAVLRILAADGFRLPKELVLFFKNVLYLGGFAAAVAPEADLLESIAAAVGQVTHGQMNSSVHDRIDWSASQTKASSPRSDIRCAPAS